MCGIGKLWEGKFAIANLAKVQAYLAGKTYDLEYDFLDRLMRVTDESGQRYQYFYDANNNMTELRVYSEEYGTKTNYSYDKDSRETKTKLMSGKERTVTYDTNGNITAITDTKGSSTVKSSKENR